MPFNPQVDNTGANFIFQSLQQAGRIGAAQRQQDQAMLGDTMKSMSANIAAAGQTYAQNLSKQRSNLGKLEAIGTMGLMPGEQLDELSKIKDPDKLAGALAVVEDGLQYRQRGQLMKDEYALRAGLALAGAQDDRTGTVTTLEDPVTGQKRGAYFQNNRQVVPFEMPDMPVAGGAQKVDLGNGMFAYFDNRGRAIPASSIKETEVDPAVAARTASLRSKVAELEGDVAKRGPNAKNGPDWWPFSDTLGTKLEGAKAELRSLDPEGTVPAAAIAPAGGAKYGSAADVKAAFAAGKIKKDEAAQILRQQFGMQ